ncbi:MAG: hypothetical protein IKN82_11555 [Treponema sp.]|nr:hypothetical protein [Treponema sp.]
MKEKFLTRTKKLLAAAALAVFLSSEFYATGYPVLDLSNLMENIEGVYQYYIQVQNMIEQVQNTYQRIQQAVKLVQSINFDKLSKVGENFKDAASSGNPFEMITAVHDSAHDITKAVDDELSKVTNLRNQLAAKSITFGGMKVSMADLCGAGTPGVNIGTFYQGAIEHTKNTAKKIGRVWSEGLTYKEKRKIWRHFGMSPERFGFLKATQYNLSKVSEESNLKGTGDGIKQIMTDIMKGNAMITKMIHENGDDSLKSAAQETTVAVNATNKAVGDLNTSVQGFQGLVSNYINQELIEKDIEKLENYKRQQRIDDLNRAARHDEDCELP